MAHSRHAAAACLLALAMAAQCFTPCFAADAHRPQPFESVYTVKAGGVAAGRMTRRLELDADDRYRFTAVVEAVGLAAMLKPTHITEESNGLWRTAHPVPAHYAHRKHSGKKRKETIIDFDTAAGLTHATINGVAVEGKLAPGAVDKLSYQLALMRDLAAGVTSLDYEVADAGGGKRYALARGADVRVKAAGRTYDTIPISYSRDDGRRTVLWCAPALAYLPVRIEYTEKDGGVTTAELLPAGSAP